MSRFEAGADGPDAGGGVAMLVLGAGGMLGSAVLRARPNAHAVRAIPWADPEAAAVRIDGAVRAFADEVGGDRWAVVWAAGRSVIASDADDVRAESMLLTSTLEALSRRLEPTRGCVLLASSVGGLYAGSTGAPFDESTEPVPRSEYGQGKLVQEEAVRAWAERTGGAAVLARIATVYGTGQDPTKEQGLVTRLCRSVLSGRPVRLYAPLDTRRHFVWEDDAGRALVDLLQADRPGLGETAVRLVAGPTSTTLAEVIRTVERVTRRTPPVLRAPDPVGLRHARDLRLRPRSAPATPYATPFLVGVARLWRSLLRTGRPVGAQR